MRKSLKAGFTLLCVLAFFGKSIARENSFRSPAEDSLSYPLQNFVRYASPLCGTGKDGNTYPGPSVPFGMIQWSPDTGPGRVVAGYNYRDLLIQGFSLDHLSGAGCYYGGNFAFTPIVGIAKETPPKDRDTFDVPFSHANEITRPGYYSVKLDDGVTVELTSTLRSGFGRFTFPTDSVATIMINSSSNVWGTSTSSIHVNPRERSVSGLAVGGHFCRTSEETTIYFYAIFDRPFLSYTTWAGDTLVINKADEEGLTSGAFITLDMTPGQSVLIKTAISYVSIANAKANLEMENPGAAFTSQEFDKTAQDANATWNAWLNKIQVEGGTDDQLETFYSMFYHTLLGPTVCSDINGQYMGYDGEVHATEKDRLQYANFSGWDIYRSECQFLAMIAPNESGDMAQSLLNDYRQGGTFPRWGVPNEDSGVMMGDPAAPIIAGFYAFGAKNFDLHDVLSGLVKAATDSSVYAPRTRTHERDALEDYLTLGYVPEHQQGGYGNVSMTLEYASADFALAQFAESLGDTHDYELLMNHAQNWQKLFNPATGFLQMRRRDGTWAPGIADSLAIYDNDRAYVEGTAEQYVWMVPFDLKSLAEKMGGQDSASRRLDRFFTQLNAGFRSKYSYVGNEPCLETPWIYCFLGRPYKTQQIVRRIVNELYTDKPIAYPGNDDLGEMSSWYIFSVLGMYPELPGSDVLVLGSPLFPNAVIHLQTGDVIIEGHGAKQNAPYVTRVSVNGKEWNKPWIRFSDICKGGAIDFYLDSTPDPQWGSAVTSAPPSYDLKK
ncbi:MAG TPA: GH92 family glycosyl hydrolase [Bacteroidota bacterium]|nr:GH92 family glycosyl hydrolase [Bacteroidota bacterium]